MRTCKECGQPIIQRDNESNSAYRMRVFCSPKCTRRNWHKGNQFIARGGAYQI